MKSWLSKAETLEWLPFLDCLQVSPDEPDLEFEQSLQQEEARMPYITTYERRGIQKGLIQKGQADVVQVLAARFESVPASIAECVSQIVDLSQLDALLTRASVVESIEVFQQFLDETLAQ